MKNKGKVISVDFDGVIIQKVLGIDWKAQKKTSISKTTNLKIIFSIFDKWWSVINHHWRQPIQGCKQGIIKIKSGGYKVILLTSRCGYHRQVTMAWLKRWGLYDLFDGFYFNDKNIGAINSKVENIKLVHPQFHIDDNRDTVDELAKTYPNLTLIHLTNKQASSYPNVTNVQSWPEVSVK